MTTNQEILEKAISKAIDGGWAFVDIPNWRVIKEYDGLYIGSVVKYDGQEWFNEDYEIFRPESIIYNHDFAKALWGEGAADDYGNISSLEVGSERVVYQPIWQYHLQRMVVADDPIQYLRDHI